MAGERPVRSEGITGKKNVVSFIAAFIRMELAAGVALPIVTTVDLRGVDGAVGCGCCRAAVCGVDRRGMVVTVTVVEQDGSGSDAGSERQGE